jgi:flagellar basal body-associated protein FliL
VADEQGPEQAAGVPAKKPVALIAGVLAVLVAGAAGVFAGPALGLYGAPAEGGAKKQVEKKKATGEEGEEEAPEEDAKTAKLPTALSRSQSLVVDIRDGDGSMHHIKLGLAVEHPEGQEHEFQKLEPRAREELIGYLRGLTFDEATDPKGFDAIRKEVVLRVRRGLGEFPVRRVIITEFVSQ